MAKIKITVKQADVALGALAHAERWIDSLIDAHMVGDKLAFPKYLRKLRAERERNAKFGDFLINELAKRA
jgi:hypothetical protein